MDILFNNFLLTQLFRIKDIEIKALPSVEITSKKIPARHGTIFQGASIGEREITVEVYLIKDYLTQFEENGTPKASVFNNFVRTITYYLQTDEPKPLIFSDEPDKYYMAICTGFDIKRLFQVGEGTITFICNDPYLYSVEEKTFTVGDDGRFHIDNEGTVETHPKVKVEFTQNATYLGIITPESVVQIGSLNPEGVTKNQTKIYKDGIQSLTKWVYGSQATCNPDCQFDDAVTCTGSGEVIKPLLQQYTDSDAPASPFSYKGTQMLTTLDNMYQSKYFDTKLQFSFSSGNQNVASQIYPAKMGIQEIRLLDINNQVIARVGMRDIWKITESNQPFAYLGQANEIWLPAMSQPTAKTQRYVKVFDNEEDVPSDATIINNYTRNKGYQTVSINYSSCPIYNTYKTGRKVKTTLKNKEGTKYRVKNLNEETYGNWIEIYLNSACTSSGWVYKTNVTVNEEETENVYVYTRKIYPSQHVGSYNDFWGYFKVARKPYGAKGDSWEFSLWRIPASGNYQQVWSKKIVDSTGTKYTQAGKLAKIAVYFGCRNDNEPMTLNSFNHLEVTAYPEQVETIDYTIATAGDIIEIDYSVPEVTLNGESILHAVDIGSRFAPLQPFMQTELEISSDGACIGEVTIQNKYL